MASRGRGRRGCPRDTGKTPPVFDQQAFVEAVGIAATAIVTTRPNHIDIVRFGPKGPSRL